MTDNERSTPADRRSRLRPGKNGKLRRYRESLDMNTPGVPFSLRQMIGRQIRVKIKHEPYEGEMYDRVDSVAKV